MTPDRTPDEATVNPPPPALTRRAASLSATVPVSGPSGLSDYAVSPLGMPVALLRDEVRVAFLGRTSTEDRQDPRQSLLRQLRGSTVVGWFWSARGMTLQVSVLSAGENGGFA